MTESQMINERLTDEPMVDRLLVIGRVPKQIVQEKVGENSRR